MADRLNSFISNIHAHILERYPPDRPYPEHAVRQMLLPLDIRHYILHVLEHRPTEALEHLPYREWFLTHDPEKQAAWKTFEQVLRSSIRIPPEAWSQLILEATTYVTRYLLDPIETLKEVVFQQAPTLPAPTVLQRMAYFRSYPYFRNILEEYVRARGISAFHRADFEQLLHRIDEKITSDYDVSDWLDHLTPLYNLSTFLPEHLSGVPVWLLRRYFRTRPYPELQRRLLHMEQVQNVSALSQEALRNLLSQVSPPPEKTAPEKGQSAPVPLWKRFAQRKGTYTPPTIRHQPSPPRHTPTPQAPTPLPEQQPGSDTAQNELEQLERAVFGRPVPEERLAFVTSLFQGQSEAYRNALEQLSTASTWERASQILAYHVFLPHKVNIYAEPAVRFTDLIEARFKREHS